MKTTPVLDENTSRGFSVYARGGQWIISFKDERTAGKKWREHRIPKTEATTEKQAEKYAARFVEELQKVRAEGQPARTGARPKVTAGGVTIRDLAERWLNLRDRDPKLSPAMKMQSRSNMKQHILRYAELADGPISDLGTAALRAWVRRIRDHGRLVKVTQKDGAKPGRGGTWEATNEPLAAYTTRNAVNTLSSFFTDVMAEEWVTLAANPMHHPGVRKEVPEGLPQVSGIHFAKAAAERLLVATTTPEARRVRYLLAFTSGLRDGEIAGLRWDDVDLDAATVNIDKALATKGPQGWASMSATKTRKSRVLPMHALTVRALRGWRVSGWCVFVGHHPKGSDFVFANANGEATRPASADLLRKDLEAAGLPSKYLDKTPFDFHATRRSFYTWLRAEGVERDTVEMLMGHSGGSVGERHYAAKDLERMRKALDMLTLDLTVGQVIAMPLRKVASDSKKTMEAECLPAEFPATFPRAVFPRGTIPNNIQYTLKDSNFRHSASKADALSS
jgi:integrase